MIKNQKDKLIIKVNNQRIVYDFKSYCLEMKGLIFSGINCLYDYKNKFNILMNDDEINIKFDNWNIYNISDSLRIVFDQIVLNTNEKTLIFYNSDIEVYLMELK